MIVFCSFSCSQEDTNNKGAIENLNEYILSSIDSNRIEDLIKIEWNGEKATVAIIKSPFYYKNDSTQEYMNKELLLFIENQEGYQKIILDTLTNEGGPPIIKEIYTANADGDVNDELFINVNWNIEHYDVSGTLIDIKVYDDDFDNLPGPMKLSDELEKYFTVSCDCSRRDGSNDKVRVRTKDDVMAILDSLEYQ